MAWVSEDKTDFHSSILQEFKENKANSLAFILTCAMVKWNFMYICYP